MSDLDAPGAVSDPEPRRYEIRVGDATAGFTEFVDSGEQRIFFHTEIQEHFAGRGLAATLIRSALDDTITTGRRVVPMCPFVAGFLDRHDEFESFVDAVTPTAQQAVIDSRR